MSDRAFALRFISGKYQGGEYPLGENGELHVTLPRLGFTSVRAAVSKR